MIASSDDRTMAARRSCTSSRSEEHTSELQSHLNLVCRLLLEKKKSNYDLQLQMNIASHLIQEKNKEYIILIYRHDGKYCSRNQEVKKQYADAQLIKK